MDVYTTGLIEWPLREGWDGVREGSEHQDSSISHIS